MVAWLLSSGTYWCWKIFSRLIFEAFMPQWLKTEAASLLHTLRLLWPQIFRNDSLYKGPLLRLYHISFEAMLVPEKGLSKSALPLLPYLRFDGSTSFIKLLLPFADLCGHGRGRRGQNLWKIADVFYAQPTYVSVMTNMHVGSNPEPRTHRGIYPSNHSAPLVSRPWGQDGGQKKQKTSGNSNF